MAKIVAVSGAQGAGKSTLLAEIQNRGYKVDDFKVSRHVQEKLGVQSLGEAIASPFSMQHFQGEIYSHKFHRDAELAKDEAPIILTERSFSDIFCYTSEYTFNFIDNGMLDRNTALSWLSHYKKLCINAQLSCYSGIVLLPLMSHVQWENDRRRAPRHSAERIYEEIDIFCSSSDFIRMPTLRITGITVDERATQLQTFLEKL